MVEPRKLDLKSKSGREGMIIKHMEIEMRKTGGKSVSRQCFHNRLLQHMFLM